MPYLFNNTQSRKVSVLMACGYTGYTGHTGGGPDAVTPLFFDPKAVSNGSW